MSEGVSITEIRHSRGSWRRLKMDKFCDGCNKLTAEEDLKEVIVNLFHTTKRRLYCRKCYNKEFGLPEKEGND